MAINLSHPNPKTCQICFENEPLPKHKLYKNFKKEVMCHSSHTFCQDCIIKHIHYKIKDKHTTIRCPGDGCTVTLDPLVLRPLIPGAVFVEWCDIMAESWVSRHVLRRSACPSDTCSEVVIDECRGGRVAREECPKCKEAFCFGCGQKWDDYHKKESCVYEERVFIDAARDWNFQRCPQCRFFVQRVDGCGVIRCRCGTSFCHRCGFPIYRCRCCRRICFGDGYRDCCTSFILIILTLLLLFVLHSVSVV